MTHHPDLTVQDVLCRSFGGAYDRLVGNEGGVTAGEDPAAVHQARVATRRLRSDLHTFRDYLDPDWLLPLRAELRWFGGELGTVRDLEVMRDRLRHHAEQLPRAEGELASRVVRRLDADREAARGELLAVMKTPRYGELVDAMRDAATHPRVVGNADALATDELPGVVRLPFEKLRTAVRELGEDPGNDELHHVRIRAKRCRYAAEAVEPAFGKPARKFALGIAAVQDNLGEHHDAVVATEWLTKTASECNTNEAYALGMLAQVEHRADAEARAAFPAVWKDANAKDRRRWL
jgi:CHAD domain-containing protein